MLILLACSTYSFPSQKLQLRQRLTRQAIFLLSPSFILKAAIQQHQLLIIHPNTHVLHMDTTAKYSEQVTNKLVHAVSAKICLHSSPSAIRHNWFAGQGKSLHALAQASQHHYCSPSPLITWSKIPPVSSSPLTLAQSIVQSKISRDPSALKLHDDLGMPCSTAYHFYLQHTAGTKP